MADKQLNFNRPLLSVRRFSSPDSRKKTEISAPEKPPIPSYKPESNPGSLRNPGSVPFVWEHSPGRPKDCPKERPPVVPKLPPGRILKHKKQDFDKITQDSNAKKGPGKKSFISSQSEEKLTTFVSSKEVKKVRSDEDGNGEICMVKDKPLEVKKVVNRENEKPQLTYGPNFLQFNGDDSEQDSDFDYDEHENMSYKVCGLLPHFCLKGSIGLLNPVPGLSVRTRLPISSANKTKPAKVAENEHKSSVNQQEDDMVSKNESPFAVCETKDVNFEKKGLVSFKELLLADKNEKESDCQNPIVEKTVYIDTIHKVETTKSSSYSSSPKGKSNFKQSDVDVLEITEMETQMGFCKYPKVDQDSKVSKKGGMELPATPPLPKSPSDSWLWRTLPSVSSKTSSLRSNPKYPSPKIAERLDKNVQLRHPQGLLLPIPET